MSSNKICALFLFVCVFLAEWLKHAESAKQTNCVESCFCLFVCVVQILLRSCVGVNTSRIVMASCSMSERWWRMARVTTDICRDLWQYCTGNAKLVPYSSRNCFFSRLTTVDGQNIQTLQHTLC